MDAVGSAIRVDSRGKEVMRILPRINEAVNEEWISDKTRHVVDGLRTQRLDRPYIRENGRLRSASWQEAFALIADKLKGTAPDRIGAIAGDLAAVEEMFALKTLIGSLGSANLDCRQDGVKLDPALGRASYVLNAGIAGIEAADSLLLIGTNPRREAPILNARIRKRWLRGDFKIGFIGERADLTYAYDYLGAGPDSLAEFLTAEAKGGKPMVLLGQGALARADGAAVLAQAVKAAQALGALGGGGWNGFGVLHTAAARVGGLDLGFVPGGGWPRCRRNAPARSARPAVSARCRRDRSADRRLRGLPGHAWRPRCPPRGRDPAGLRLHREIRHIRQHRRPGADDRPRHVRAGDAREDWAILRALSAVIGKTLPFDTLSALRRVLYEAHPHFAALDTLPVNDAAGFESIAARSEPTDKAGFVSAVEDFYQTNPIARASAVMAECSSLAAGRLPQGGGVKPHELGPSSFPSR